MCLFNNKTEKKYITAFKITTRRIAKQVKLDNANYKLQTQKKAPKLVPVKVSAV
jgi:hypothetical protein